MAACFGLLCLLTVSVIIRSFTTNVLVKWLHVDNDVTQAILFDNAELKRVGRYEDIPIKWNELYPFKEEDLVSKDPEKGNIVAGITDKIQRKADVVKGKISHWTTGYLVGYVALAEPYNAYKKMLHWNIMGRKEYNGVFEMEDGQLATFQDRVDVSEKVKNVTTLARFCKENGAVFLYVSAPSKISRHDERYKTLDFCNANADAFLSGLKENGVDYIDIRDNMEEEGFTAKDLFYRTDHHWTQGAGLWAAGIISRYLNEKGIIKSDMSLLKPDMWDEEVYKNFYLGSRGKKITLQRTTAEDFIIYHPKWPTHLHMEIPSKAIVWDGDFDITYNRKPLEAANYYDENPYTAYSWENRPYKYIRNGDAVNDKSVLMIKNSFANVVYPFLALQFKYAHEIDLRVFNGSLQEVIKQKKPDVVIVLYHMEELAGNVDYEGHLNLWDFR